MKYKVVSGRLSEAVSGQIVDSEDLFGCSINALLDGGHLVAAEGKIKSDVTLEVAED